MRSRRIVLEAFTRPPTVSDNSGFHDLQLNSVVNSCTYDDVFLSLTTSQEMIFLRLLRNPAYRYRRWKKRWRLPNFPLLKGGPQSSFTNQFYTGVVLHNLENANQTLCMLVTNQRWSTKRGFGDHWAQTIHMTASCFSTNLFYTRKYILDNLHNTNQILHVLITAQPWSYTTRLRRTPGVIPTQFTAYTILHERHLFTFFKDYYLKSQVRNGCTFYSCILINI